MYAYQLVVMLCLLSKMSFQSSVKLNKYVPRLWYTLSCMHIHVVCSYPMFYCNTFLEFQVNYMHSFYSQMDGITFLNCLNWMSVYTHVQCSSLLQKPEAIFTLTTDVDIKLKSINRTINRFHWTRHFLSNINNIC